MNTQHEQLAIALMAEARKLYKDGTSDAVELADRLAGWATDVRALGVRHGRAIELLEAERVKLACIRKAVLDG